jgi:hypothetical protein
VTTKSAHDSALYHFLAFILRDKLALVMPSAIPPMLVTIPVDPPFKGFQRYEIDAKLSDTGVLEGKLPDDAPVKLVCRALLVCTGGNLGCDFTLFTIDSVRSTE